MHRIKIRWPDFAAFVCIWIVIAILVIGSIGMPVMVEGSPGPRFMPLLMAALMAVLSVLYLAGKQLSGSGVRKQIRVIFHWKSALYVGLSLLIIILWERLGAVFSILIIGFVLFKTLEGLSWLKSAVAAVVMAGVIYLIFDRLLNINLPAGIAEGLLRR